MRDCSRTLRAAKGCRRLVQEPGGFFAIGKWHSDEIVHECAKQRFLSGTFAQSATIACPSLAHAATIDPRSGNTVRSLPRICRAEWALHKRERTDVWRGQPLPRQQSRLGWRARKSPTAQSTPRRNPGTWGSEHGGRDQPRPSVAAGRTARACRVPSIRSPKRSAGQPQIPAPREAPPTIANVLCPSCPLGNRATVAAARTTMRRTLHLLPVTLPRLDIDAREQPSKDFIMQDFIMHMLKRTRLKAVATRKTRTRKPRGHHLSCPNNAQSHGGGVRKLAVGFNTEFSGVSVLEREDAQITLQRRQGD